MANPLPARSDASAGAYRCVTCGYGLDVDSARHPPPCPTCGTAKWYTVAGDDVVNGPDPDHRA